MRVGVVVNPLAGGGIDEAKRLTVNRVLGKLRPDVVYSARGLGAELISGFVVRKLDLKLRGTREDTVELVKMLDGLVDVIAVFGGDGTVSDAASARPKTPLLCVGVGTTNVSPALCGEDFEPSRLREVKLAPLELKAGSELRLALNDVVVGSTVLSTVNGRRVQVDAREYMLGKKIVARPRKFYARVEVGNKVLEGTFGNIFVSMPDERFLGKGIAGGASLSAFLRFKGVVACLSEGIVVSTYTKEDVKAMEPIVTRTLSFDDEVVKIWANEVISCDGNPVAIGGAEVRVVDNAITVLKS